MVGGMRWCSSVSRLNTDSTAPAAESVWPIIDLFDEIGMRVARSPNTAETLEIFLLVVFRRAGAVRR